MCSRIFDKVIAIIVVAIINTTTFLPLALSFLLSFSFVIMILELLGLKKHALWRFFTQMTTNVVRLVFKKSA